MSVTQFIRLALLVTASEVLVGSAAALADPADTHDTLVWLTNTATGGGNDALTRLFLLLAALGLVSGLTTASALGLFELLRRRSD